MTGGAQGIGRAIAERLLGSGAAVALWDRDEELVTGTARELADNGEVSTAMVDVTDAEAVAGAFASAVERHGAVDIMINNAGIAGPTVPSWEYPLDEWRSVVDVDLNGVYYCCRAALPHMRERDYGRIVNVASIAGGEPVVVAGGVARALRRVLRRRARYPLYRAVMAVTNSEAQRRAHPPPRSPLRHRRSRGASHRASPQGPGRATIERPRASCARLRCRG